MYSSPELTLLGRILGTAPIISWPEKDSFSKRIGAALFASIFSAIVFLLMIGAGSIILGKVTLLRSFILGFVFCLLFLVTNGFLAAIGLVAATAFLTTTG